MTSLIMAWLVGEGLIIWRAVGKQRRPPLPAELLVTSGLFLLLALLGEKDARLAGLLGWGFVVAAWVANPPTKIAPGKDTTQASAGSAGGVQQASTSTSTGNTRPGSSSGPSAAALSV